MRLLPTLMGLLTAVSLMISGGVSGQDSPAEIPSLTTYEVTPEDMIEREVTITETDRGTIHEYSVDGRVYMVKIVPKSGLPYYLLDSNGDGRLDVRSNNIDDISVPQWVLFSW